MTNRNNYAAKMALKKQGWFDAGLVSERFPNISGIIINMAYYQKGPNPVLMRRTVNILPASYAYFNMECMIKGCADGGFDLTSVIANMVKTRKNVKKGNIICRGKIDTKYFDHASIEYNIAIKYYKA